MSCIEDLRYSVLCLPAYSYMFYVLISLLFRREKKIFVLFGSRFRVKTDQPVAVEADHKSQGVCL